ncbi:Fc.00g068900.m01.CDS01 [Cosmosporella sp. VM-42]
MDPTLPTNNPLMPPAKQQRILVWRNEVASALSTNPAPSLASSHTSTSLSSDLEPPSPNTTPSRPRSLWKRLSSRFTGRSRHADEMAPQMLDSEGGERTAMWRNESTIHARLQAEGEETVGLGDKSSEGGGRGLKEKQERLRRAARLLNQGGSRRE